MMDPSDAITRGYGIGQGHLVAGSVLRHALGLPHHALASFRTSVTRLTKAVRSWAKSKGSASVRHRMH